MRRRLLIHFIVFNVGLGAVLAQGDAIQINGGFMEDSIAIGKPVHYYLSARYPDHEQLLFPDSTHSFAPYEFVSKKFFPTITKASVSYDSVVYTLTSFEIDNLQALALPVYVVQEKDCLSVLAKIDTLFFQPHVEAVPDSTLSEIALKADTQYRPVLMPLNYIVIGLIVLGCIIILGTMWYFTKDRIWAYIQQVRLRRRHSAFLIQFEAAVRLWEQHQTAVKAEGALSIWKRYMETLLKQPITTYTTREIKEHIQDQNLYLSLKKVDAIIYGGVSRPDNPFSELKAIGEDNYYMKLEKIQHGGNK